MGADADTAVVLCRGGQPLQHLIELAECPLAFVDCDLPLDEQVAACGATRLLSSMVALPTCWRWPAAYRRSH